jgi:glycine cleavage system H protein
LSRFGCVVTGWLCQIKLTNPADFETLLTAEAYQKICEN